MFNTLGRLILAVDREHRLARLLEPGLLVSHLEVHIPDLPASLAGFTLMQLSDLHVGPGRWRPLYVQQVREVWEREQPHALVNTGDFSHQEPDANRVAEVVCEYLPANPSLVPQAHVAVLGNHDYAEGPDLEQGLKTALGERGVQVLENSATRVVRGDAGVTLVGITDETSGFLTGVQALLEAERPRIALIHEPDLVNRLPWAAADLVLCGHTHGGQLTLPGLQAWIVRQFSGSRYVGGVYHIQGMPVYVNRGLGYTGLPLRFRVRPEVTVVHLLR